VHKSSRERGNKIQKTNIEWVKNPDGSQGYSWNPITGCLDKCGYCYARRLAYGRLRAKYLSNNILASHNEPNHKEHHTNPFYPRFWPERLKELQKAKYRTYGGGVTQVIHQRDTTSKGIFVCNMCEFFGDWVPTNWQREIFNVIRANYQHRFYFLTKQPWNVAKFSPFPDNCWVGVTVCNKQMAFYASMYYFRLVRAKVKYISFEPLLEDITEMIVPSANWIGGIIQNADWVIIGSQTKPYNPPKIEWVQKIVEVADNAGKPVFLKDNLKPLLGNNLQQELPECKCSP
jgi:protein gp37